MVLVIFAVTTFSSCRNERSPYLLRDIVPKSELTFIDSLKEKAILSYVTDPDLAECLLDQATHACDSIRMPQKKFQILLEKAEFYQYRKPDFLKSVKNLSEAVGIFIQYPGPYAEDPYIYINIGNFFYRLHHFDKANSFYRLGVIMSEKLGLLHAQAIALQNIGLSWQEMNVYDSALYYFKYSRDFSLEVGYLTRAQSFLYLSELSFIRNDLNMVKVHTDSSFGVIRKFWSQRPEDLGTVYPKLVVAGKELESKLHNLLFRYFRSKNAPDSAAYHQELAVRLAREISSYPLLAEIYLEKLQHSMPAGNSDVYQSMADSVLYSAMFIRDPFIYKEFLDSLTSFFTRAGTPDLAEKYTALSVIMADSLNQMLGSEELLENQMLISSAAAEQVIQKLQYEQSQNHLEIIFFRTISLIIITVVLLAIVFMVVMIRQKRSLKIAYWNLSVRIQQSLFPVQPMPIEIKLHGADKKAEIIKHLEELIEVQRIFVNKELTLLELATILQTNKTYLSEFINSHYGLNFNEFINQQRVREACRLMMQPESDRLSFDQISEKCGFNSRSTFYAAFKKSTGMSPAAFSRTLRM